MKRSNKRVRAPVWFVLLWVSLTLCAGRSFGQLTNSVAGAVVDPEGKLLPHIQIQAISENGNGVTTAVTETDAYGQYRFGQLPDGTYTLLAGPDDTEVLFQGVLSVSSTSTAVGLSLQFPLDLRQILTPSPDIKTSVRPIIGGPARISVSGSDREGVTTLVLLLLPSAVKVSGHVIIPPGVTLPPELQAIITGINAKTTSNVAIHPDGTFEFPFVPPGDYKIHPLPNLGLIETTITVSNTDITNIELRGPDDGVPVRGAVPPSEPAIVVKKFLRWIYLIGDGELAGINSESAFLMSLDSPLAKMPQIPAVDVHGNAFDLPVAPVSSDGHFDFLSVAPGNYYVRTIPDTRIPNTKIHVARGGGTINASVGASVRVRGEVVPANSGNRFPDVITLTAAGPAGVQDLTATIDANGQFEFPKVGAGTYRVVFDYRLRPNPSEITIDDRDEIVRFAVPFNSWISGKVTFLGPSLPEGTRESIRAALTDGTDSPIGADGSFRLKSRDGEYEFFMLNLPEGWTVKSAFYGADNLLTDSVKVDSLSAPRDISVTVEYKPDSLRDN